MQHSSLQSQRARVGAVPAGTFRHWTSSSSSPSTLSISVAIIMPHRLESFCLIFCPNAQVDSSRLALWGTSMAGGHVLVIASELGRNVTAGGQALMMMHAGHESMHDKGNHDIPAPEADEGWPVL